MSEIALSEAAFECLLKHLVEIEEGKKKLLDEYYPDMSSERDEIVTLIDNYIKHIDNLLRNTKRSQSAGSAVPFVTIGSEVEIQDIASMDIFRYRIVSPFLSKRRDGDVSYLSPVGKSLLLKSVGDRVEVKAPGGTFRYRIKSIQLAPDTEDSSR